jgi:biopolymer transport protein ExbD
MAEMSLESDDRGKRRSLNSEVNMIPMIDLLIVTVSFLLITAVWSTMGRMDASAQAPAASDDPAKPPRLEHRMHLTLRGDEPIHASWRIGEHVEETFDVPRGKGAIRYEGVTAKLGEHWRRIGDHRDPSDPAKDTVVLHVDDSERYEEVVGLMDAVAGVRKGKDPAMTVIFATK